MKGFGAEAFRQFSVVGRFLANRISRYGIAVAGLGAMSGDRKGRSVVFVWLT